MTVKNILTLGLLMTISCIGIDGQPIKFEDYYRQRWNRPESLMGHALWGDAHEMQDVVIGRVLNTAAEYINCVAAKKE